jgi:glucokinase
LLDYLRRCHSVPQISVERVVSGPGIASIYQFLREQTPERETPKLAQVREQWVAGAGRENGGVDLSAAVSEAALAGGDVLCREAMRLFVCAYGAEAGNLALKVLCKGGLYVAGGVAPKILPLLEDGTFIEAFRNKGRMRPLMEAIPVRVVLNPKVGLLGAALCAVT